jgi:flavin reductase (DIM6/NTAB) family NADH-FMN oxidoreductase RutF
MTVTPPAPRVSLGAKTLHFPVPTCVVGTYDAEGKANVMTAAWSGICCSRPPCVYVSLREATYTYHAIKARRAYTISIPSDEHIEAVDYFGIATGREEDKLARTGLTAVRSELVDAPYVQEFSVALECKLVRTEELGLHTLFVGEILDVKGDPAVIKEGRLDIEKIRPVIYDPARNRYYKLGDYLAKAFTVGKALRS